MHWRRKWQPTPVSSEVQCEAHLPSCVILARFTAGGRRGSVQAGVMEGKTGEVIKGQAVESHLEDKYEKRMLAGGRQRG